jgi:hypothetical protein
MTYEEILAGMRARRDALDRERAALDEAIIALESVHSGYAAVTHAADVTTKASAQRIADSLLTTRSVRKEPKPVASARPPVLAGPPAPLQIKILATLKESGPLSPGALARRLGVSVSHLYHHTKPLLMSGRLVGSGARENRRLALP